MFSQSIEDYVEAIYKLSNGRENVRIIDIARSLEIKPPSVVEMLHKLEANKLISYDKRTGVKLTLEGEKLASSVEQKHRTLVDFLILLGVTEDLAEDDACKIEHSIHPATAEKLTKFVKKFYPKRTKVVKTL